MGEGEERGGGGGGRKNQPFKEILFFFLFLMFGEAEKSFRTSHGRNREEQSVPSNHSSQPNDFQPDLIN